jgi:hypothetical protein
VRHRLHHVRGGRRDWDAFFAAAAEDPALPAGLRTVAELAAAHDIAFVTGRPERTREQTRAWLAAQGLPTGVLVMRADGDHRPARVLKAELVAGLAADHDVAVVLDDDPAVCAALEKAGHAVRRADFAPDAEAYGELHGTQERGRN